MVVKPDYNYAVAGFNDFMQRSIGTGTNTVQQINFDQQQTTGSLGDKFQIGSILIDGSKGRITIADDNGNTIVVIGELDD